MPEHTQLCLVSAQPTPNLTPALDPGVAPRRIILLVSPDMRQRADWLEAVLKPRGIGIERWEIADAFDIEHIQQRVLELLERERERVLAADIALNATGGTKPMSIAAYEVFRAYDLPIFYVHPEQDRLIWMHPQARPARDLDNRVRLDAFLQAHGANLESSVTASIPADRQTITDWLVANTHRLGAPLGTLNWLANKSERTLLSPELEQHQLERSVFSELIDRLADAGLVTLQGRRLRFPDEAARFYANGGWLEEHVYATLGDLRREKRQVQDLARGLELHRRDARGAEVHNEIDVACLAENRLYLIECKTRRWGKGDAQDPGNDALYRLETLSDLLGGLQGRAMLVSYLDLPPAVRRRAEDLRIRVCTGARLPELRHHLGQWIG